MRFAVLHMYVRNVSVLHEMCELLIMKSSLHKFLSVLLSKLLRLVLLLRCQRKAEMAGHKNRIVVWRYTTALLQ